MSGIAGIVNLDGAPVDRSLLHSLTDELKRRGSDAEAVWIDGHVGFGHALLRTSDESEQEDQPSTLDGRIWITADARVDGRGDLARDLIASGHVERLSARDLESATDAALLLHSYRAWGERCVEHLLGDYAFAIWDSARQRLLCARDQLGVNPFFFAIAGACVVFASSLDCVRRHPDVSDDLDDLAIADFLLFGHSQEPDSTMFAAVRRLQPGHTLTVAGGRPRLSRYWELLPTSETRFPRRDDYVERFQDLLRMAVADRVGTKRIGVLMSGGVDSPLVAAVAKNQLRSRNPDFDIRAHTVIYESLIPDEERRYAGIAANALGIPIDYQAADRYPLFAGWRAPDWGPPEPSSDPLSKITVDVMSAIAAHSRVALTGYDGDALCAGWLASHFRALLQSLHLGRALSDATWFMLARRSLPPVGFRTRVRQRKGRQQPPSLPPWLRHELVAQLALRERWQQYAAPRRSISRPVREDAVEQLTGPILLEMFDTYDPALTKSPVQVRHPLMDLRIVHFMFSLPPIPWSVDKTVLRTAGARVGLPTSICRRPKAPAAEDNVGALIRQSGDSFSGEIQPTSTLSRYVSADALPSLRASEGSELFWPLLWVFSLEQWLLARGLGG